MKQTTLFDSCGYRSDLGRTFAPEMGLRSSGQAATLVHCSNLYETQPTEADRLVEK